MHCETEEEGGLMTWKRGSVTRKRKTPGIMGGISYFVKISGGVWFRKVS